MEQSANRREMPIGESDTHSPPLDDAGRLVGRYVSDLLLC